MPSVDVIRNITIKGKADGVDDATAALNRLTDSIKSANDNLAKSSAVANDNSAGWRITGEGAATAANHLRQAAEAAYAFSPAFRGVVNEMAVPALKFAGTALEDVAAGIVTATNVAGTGLVSLAAAAEKVNPNFLGLTSNVRAAGIAMEAFSPTLGGAAASIGAVALRFVPLLGQILLVYDAVKLSTVAWQLATQRLEEYNNISNNAIGVSTDFYQRITKAATDAKLPIDDLTAAFKKMNDALTPKLGGSDGLNRLKELTDVGNFKGNAGVDQLKSATGSQQQFEALVKLVHDAGDASQRLAAIDLTKTIFGETAAANLSKDYDYLDKIKQKTDSISGADIVSDADVARAVLIQERFDAAYKTLSERWHPLQQVLTELGEKFKLEWLSFLEAIAGIATALEKAYTWAERLVKLGLSNMKANSNFLNPAAEGPLDDNIGSTLDFKKRQLGSALAQPTQVQRGVDDLNSIYSSVRGDKSNDPNIKPPDTSAYDRATETVLKYIETTKAASLAVSDAAGEQEKFKVIAQLTAAGMKDGLTPEAAKLKAEMSGLGQQAGVAADALAKAKEVSAIDFGRKTSLLSADDVAIATQLKGIYGNDVPAALNSTYAAGIRVNTAFKTISSAIETNLTQGLTDIVSGAKSAGLAFSDMGKAIVTAIEQMIIKIAIVQPLMQALQNSVSGSGGILSSLGIGGSSSSSGGFSATALPGAANSAFYGPVAPGMHSGGIVGAEATFNRYIHPAYFDNAPRFHTGGIAGDEIPVIAKRGEGIFTPAQMAAMGGAGSGTQVNVNVQNFGNDNVSVKQKQNSNGGVDLEVMVGQAAASQMAKKGSALRQVTDNRQLLASR